MNIYERSLVVNRSFVRIPRFNPARNQVLCKARETKFVVGHAEFPKEPFHLQILATSECWFLRFGLDPSLQFMVVGNMIGNLLIFDLASMPNTRETAKLSHSQCTGIVRQTGLSLPLSPSLSLSLAPCPSSSASPAPLHAAVPEPHPPPSHQSLISFCSPPPLRPLPYPLARYNPRLPSSQSPTPWQPLSRSTHMPDVSVPN